MLAMFHNKISIRLKLLFLALLVLSGNGFIGYSIYKSRQKLDESEKYIREAEQVISYSAKIRSLSQNLVLASWGYMITSNPDFLKVMYPASETIAINIYHLRHLSANNPMHFVRIDTLNTFIQKVFAVSAETIRIKNHEGTAPAMAFVSENNCWQYTDSIVLLVKEIQLAETLFLEQKKSSNQFSRSLYYMSSVILFLLLAVFTTLLLIATAKYLVKSRDNELKAGELLLANQELLDDKIQKDFKRNNLKALINNTNDLMWSVDRGFSIITYNQPFDELIIYLSGHKLSIGDNVLSIGFSPEILFLYKGYYERAFKGETFTEVSFTDKPEPFWSEVSFHPIRSGDEVIGTACHSRNITERKKSELLVQQQNKELLKTNTELDRFVYSVSHDLRSPLISVLGLVSFIEEESKEPNTLNYARMIRKSVNRLDAFIKNILNYSKNNRVEMKVEKIQLLEVINETVDSLSNIKEAIGIDFRINVDQPCAFYTDHYRFTTVIENLIANAIKYHRNDSLGRYIEIAAQTDKDNLHLTITDNGIGIPREYQASIFEMFFRISGKSSGSGLGLYIVREIVEKLQGQIAVKSDETTGTSFHIVLKNQTPNT